MATGFTAQDSDIKFLSIVPYTFLPAQTGGKKAIALFNKYLSNEAELFCATTRRNRNTLAEYHTFSVFSGSKLRYVNVFYFFTLRRYIRANKITHIIIEHPYFGWLGVWLRNSCGIRLVLRSHNIESIRWKTLGKWWWKALFYYEKWVCRKSDFNLFITDEDRAFAESAYRLRPQKNITATYGIEIAGPPSAQEKLKSRRDVQDTHRIENDELIILFNGAFDYAPNVGALKAILYQINPIMAVKPDFRYRILVCGKDIPAELLAHDFPNVTFAGFVDDISTYLLAADIFINPVMEGGGIKTKLVEALAYNLNCVSFASGAIGIPRQVYGQKLLQADDGDIAGFVAQIIVASMLKDRDIPDAFFHRFFWKNIIRKVLDFLSGNTATP